MVSKDYDYHALYTRIVKSLDSCLLMDVYVYRKVLSPDPHSTCHEKMRNVENAGRALGQSMLLHVHVYKLSLKKGDLCDTVDSEHGSIQLSCRGGEVHNHSIFLLKQLRKHDLSHL